MSGHTRKALLAVLTVGMLVLLAGVASAGGKKPPKEPPQDPSPDTGVIYYLDGSIWSMAYDGSNKQALGIDGTLNLDPTELTHSGQRWFLTALPVADPPYPNGAERWEIFAVNESGGTFQLTDNPEAEMLYASDDGWADGEGGRWGRLHAAAPRWRCGDTSVTYWARRWQDGAIVEGSEGLYEVEVDWSGPDTTPTKMDVNMGSLQWSVFSSYDWSPDGTQFVCRDRQDGGLYVVDVGTGAPPSLIATGTDAEWSPVPGVDRILFRDGENLYSVASDGSDERLIVSRSDVQKDELGGGVWSPNATHVAYDVRTGHRLRTGTVNVYRANIQGEYETNLTGDLESDAIVIAWRAE